MKLEVCPFMSPHDDYFIFCHDGYPGGDVDEAGDHHCKAWGKISGVRYQFASMGCKLIDRGNNG